MAARPRAAGHAPSHQVGGDVLTGLGKGREVTKAGTHLADWPAVDDVQAPSIQWCEDKPL